MSAFHNSLNILSQYIKIDKQINNKKIKINKKIIKK